MTETDAGPNGDSSEAPEPIVESGRGISVVWIIPIVAVLVGAAIGIEAIRNRGVDDRDASDVEQEGASARIGDAGQGLVFMRDIRRVFRYGGAFYRVKDMCLQSVGNNGHRALVIIHCSAESQNVPFS